MSQDAVSELAQEMRDLLDVGRVGLYEFMWELNSTQKALSLDDRRTVARRALDELLAEPDVDLVLMKWPDWGVIRRVSVEEIDTDAWNDIGEDGLYLAIDRRPTDDEASHRPA